MKTMFLVAALPEAPAEQGSPPETPPPPGDPPPPPPGVETEAPGGWDRFVFGSRDLLVGIVSAPETPQEEGARTRQTEMLTTALGMMKYHEELMR